MIEYLKSVLGQQMAAQRPETNEDSELDNSTILEYASLFQELDDLSEKGTAIETAVRTPISIPLEDDIELDSIEINLTDGRVTDIPADATVQESTVEDDIRELEQIEQQYAGMKSYTEFFEEAFYSTERLPRESDERFESRVREKADARWAAYNDSLYQEGVFGHGKIDVNDLSVPDKIHMNFGKTSESNTKDYTVTIPIMWEVDKKKQITKKQLDSVHVWSKFGRNSLEKMSNEIFKKISDKYNVPEKKQKWDVLTPTVIAVPVDPADEYIIVIGFETDFSKNTEYWSLSIPVKAIEIKKDSDITVPDNALGSVSNYTSIDKKEMIRKRDYKLEQEEIRLEEEQRLYEESCRMLEEAKAAAEERYEREHNRFYYQEAIDFGGGDASAAPAADADAGVDTPPAETDTSGEDAANIDASADADATADVDAAAGDTSGGDEAATTPDAEEANVNDVSDQIADKVAQNTEDQTSGEDGDLSADTIDEEEPDKDDLDSEIDSLDDSSSENPEDAGATDLSMDSLDDMTIDELLKQGSDKLKSMTLNQLKSFITSPDGTSPEDVKQEAFVQESKKSEANTQRAKNAIEKIISRLEYIQNGIKSGWTDRDIKQCFVPVKTGTAGRPMHMKYREKESAFFKKELMDMVSFIKRVCKHSDVTDAQVREFKRFVSDMKDYVAMCTKDLDKNRAGIKAIADKTSELILAARKLVDITPTDMKNEVVKEESVYSPEDEKVMMEYFFTDASNIRKRIRVSIEDVIPGLEKIKVNCGNGKWDRYKFREFWKDVPDETGLDGLGGERHGNQFRSYVEDLTHFLKIAHKKRARDIFTEAQLSDINDCITRLDNFSRLCNKASKTIYVKEDVSMSELSDWADMAIKSCKHIMELVKSEEFAEFYINEASLITKKNINQEMLSHIKISLGVLNNTEDNFQELVKAFKKESKRLNRILNKATKMDGMYTETERQAISKMNDILLELSSNIRMNNLNDSYTNRVKASIKEYVNQCKIVSDIIEKHIGISGASKLQADEETIQESAVSRASKIRQQLKSQLNKTYRGFKILIEGIDNKGWTEKDFLKFWKYTTEGKMNVDWGLNSNGDVTIGVRDNAVSTGDYFCVVIDNLCSLLKKVDSKKMKDEFTVEQVNTMLAYRDSLKEFRDIGMNIKAQKVSKYSIEDIAERADDLIKMTENVQKIVSDKKFTEAFIIIEEDTDTTAPCCQSAPTVKAEDASETPELGETMTANTTTGVDTTAASATPETPSGTPADTPTTPSTPSGTPETNVNECGEVDVAKRFEEFMNSY